MGMKMWNSGETGAQIPLPPESFFTFLGELYIDF